MREKKCVVVVDNNTQYQTWQKKKKENDDQKKIDQTKDKNKIPELIGLGCGMHNLFCLGLARECHRLDF